MTEEKEYYEVTVKTNCGKNVCLGNLYFTGRGLEGHHVRLNADPSSRKLEYEVKKISKEVFEKSKKDNNDPWWMDLD
jgi:hypothetical protein